MDKIIVHGGSKLSGEVVTSGSKNAALPILFSTLLADGTHKFKNIPKLNDIKSTIELLKFLNCEIVQEDSHFTVSVKSTDNPVAPYDLVRKMRASVLCLGPLLARYGKATVSMPGGCAIGTRPIDRHLDGLAALGAEIETKKGNVHVSANKLAGTTVIFEGVTVTGTQNIMMAATLAEGETVIENAAKEPEVVDLAIYLKKMGAKITGEGTSIIKIVGVEKLNPSEHEVLSDRIEAGTLILAGAITGGNIKVKNCVPNHLEALILKMEESGFSFNQGSDWIEIKECSSWKGVDVTTAVFPGFATDLQAQFMALMTVAEGTSIVTESIFENRFMHVAELIRMNADITPKSRVSIIRGRPNGLVGAPVMATDLRASACLVLAGLASKGETTVNRVYHLDRGYEFLEKKLANLGAKIKRVSE